MDVIFIDDPYCLMPPIETACDPVYIKHVHCVGARFHVLSWSGRIVDGKMTSVTHCSEKKCIENKFANELDKALEKQE